MKRLYRYGIVSLMLTFFLSSLFLTGCSNKEVKTAADVQKAEKQKLVIGVGRDFYYGPSDPTCVHGSTNVWESLTYLDNKLNPQPQLAESWEVSPDGKVWTFRLRKNVKFHDGSPFNAEIAVLNMKRLLKHPKVDARQIYGDLKDVRVIDDYTIQFEHNTPAPEFPGMIAYFNSAMLSPASFDGQGNIKEPIGTGPFVFKQYVKDDAVILAANKDYWSKKPLLEEVVFKFIPDANTRLAALQNGEVDVLSDVGAVMPEQAAIIKNNKKLTLKTQEVATTHYLFVNKNRDLFKNNDLFRAVSMVINRQELVDKVLEGYGKSGQSVITPLATKWLNEEVAPLYNLQEAKNLAQTVLKDTKPPVTLLVNSGLSNRWPYKSIAEILQYQLAQIGLQVKIEMVDAGAWNKQLKAGNYDLSLTPFTLMTGEPNFFFSTHMLSTGDLNKNRSYGYKNNEADKLISQAAVEKDAGKRRQLYLELQKIAAEQGPLTPIYHDTTLYACNIKVKNFELDASFKPNLAKVEITN